MPYDITNSGRLSRLEVIAIRKPDHREEDGWALDSRLARDCIVLCDLGLSRLLLMDDALYPWLILVPRRPGLTEIVDLNASDRAALMEEIAGVSAALKRVTHCDKLNVAALGNAVSQLHMHVIARSRNDPAWPNPVWGRVPPRRYAPEEVEPLRAALLEALSL